MTNLKHVGRMLGTKRRVIVAYRVVPDEPENCIVVTTENLGADEHDSLIKLLESSAGQESNDFALVMGRSTLPDGRNMLAHFHRTGKMAKVPADQVELMPNRNTSIMLDQLNEIVAQQKGVTVSDLAVTDGARKPLAPEETSNKVAQGEFAQTADILSDEDLAKQLRSQADAMFKEAKKLREQAEELSPIKKTKKADQANEESV